MVHGKRMQRALLRAAAGVVGTGALGIALAVPASASPVASDNNLVIMSGSQTTYPMMMALSTLYDESPGCNLTAPSSGSQVLDFQCAGNDTGGQNGLGDNDPTTLDGAWTTISAATDVSTSATDVPVSSVSGFTTDGWGTSSVGSTASGGGTLDTWTFTDQDGALGSYQGSDTPSEVSQITCTGASSSSEEFTGCKVASGKLDLASGQEISTQYLGGDNQNPYNDVVVQEPALGSSNGIKQLENTGSDDALVDAARSSRGPNNGQALPTGDPVTTAATDDPGLNFVAYAQDAVPWLHWTEVKDADTPSFHISSLSIPVLSTIYGASCYVASGNTCSANAGITNWGQICSSVSSSAPSSSKGQYNLCYDYSGAPSGYVTAVNNAGGGSGHCVLPSTDTVPYTFAEFQKACPIDVYQAQSGAGTESTWATVLDISASPEGLTYRGATYTDSHTIFENEITSILKDKDEADALFYFSYGNFHTECQGALAECGSAHTGKDSKMVLGAEVVTENGRPVKPDTTTIENGTYPTDRYLYNVYSDGRGSFPASPQAALNFIGEDGFICQESSDVDSNSTTGATYGSEIQSIIKSNGFLPLPDESDMYPTQGSLTATPEVLTDPEYRFVDPQYADGTSATGHCLVFTTDGDGG